MRTGFALYRVVPPSFVIALRCCRLAPQIDQAKKAVSGITKSNLDWLRGLRQPPSAIQDVLSGVLRVFGYSDNSWQKMKQFLGQKEVIDQILDFDPRSMTKDTRREVDQLIREHANSFEEQVIYHASPAAGPMADWVKAVLKYSAVVEKIRPLEIELSKLDQKLDASRVRLKECERQLQEINQKVEGLKKNFAQKTQVAEVLKADLQKAEHTLSLARNLLDKLEDERVRWERQSKSIELEFKSYPVESMLATCFTVYLSDADENTREGMLRDWVTYIGQGASAQQRASLQEFSFLRFMASESTILSYKQQGLPGDSLSLENSVMIFNSSKVPLLVDPNTQATEWLKKNLSQLGGIEILNQQDAKFTNKLELAVRFGKTLFIQELDQIESILTPILRRDLSRQGPRWVVMIGDKYVDFNEQFKLYLCTRNASIDLQPMNAALITIINFTVTKSGLEGKLLSIIINHEQPQLEQEKQELLEKEESLKLQLSELEKNILEELADAQGNILENTVLLDSLNQTKSKSQNIQKSLAQSAELQKNIDEKREVYRELASKGATLFILICDLRKVNNMYRFSLAYFIDLFQKCLKADAPTQSMQDKLQHQSQNLRKIVFNSIASSLFKQDRLMFALHLVHGTAPALFEPNEWELFIGNIPLNVDAAKVQMPKWARADCAEHFGNYLAAFPKFAQLVNFNDREWEKWYLEPDCENQFPPSYRSKFAEFQKIILVQIFRPERLQSAINNFVCQALLIPSVAGYSPSFRQIVENDMNTLVPALFVVSPGSDPSKELKEFATGTIGKDNFQELSMGGNQNEAALRMLKDAAAQGTRARASALRSPLHYCPTAPLLPAAPLGPSLLLR